MQEPGETTAERKHVAFIEIMLLNETLLGRNSLPTSYVLIVIGITCSPCHRYRQVTAAVVINHRRDYR